MMPADYEVIGDKQLAAAGQRKSAKAEKKKKKEAGKTKKKKKEKKKVAEKSEIENRWEGIFKRSIPYKGSIPTFLLYSKERAANF